MYCLDEEFAAWAFGRGLWDGFMSWNADVIDLMRSWNAMHGALYTVADEDMTDPEALREILKIMKQLYFDERGEDESSNQST